MKCFADLTDLPDRISSDLGFKSNICLYCLKNKIKAISLISLIMVRKHLQANLTVLWKMNPTKFQKRPLWIFFKKSKNVFSGSWVEALLKPHIVCIPNSTIDFVGLLLHF